MRASHSGENSAAAANGLVSPLRLSVQQLATQSNQLSANQDRLSQSLPYLSTAVRGSVNRRIKEENASTVQAQCKHDASTTKAQCKHNASTMQAQCKQNASTLQVQCTQIQAQCKHNGKHNISRMQAQCKQLPVHASTHTQTFSGVCKQTTVETILFINKNWYGHFNNNSQIIMYRGLS